MQVLRETFLVNKLMKLMIPLETKTFQKPEKRSDLCLLKPIQIDPKEAQFGMARSESDSMMPLTMSKLNSLMKIKRRASNFKLYTKRCSKISFQCDATYSIVGAIIRKADSSFYEFIECHIINWLLNCKPKH